ncbi:TIGR00730 family Rossman fold protein [Bacteroidales bacterium]
MGAHPVYRDVARQLGRILAQRKIKLVYGGASVGLMKVLADAALRQGGFVTGIMPHMLIQKEIVHQEIQQFLAVETMAERKTQMIEMSDGFIAMPGGFGTLDELSEILTFNQLRITNKPLGLLNVNGYFDALLRFFDQGVEQGFVRAEHRDNILIHSEPETLLQMMQRWQPVATEKWINDIRLESQA